MNLSVRKEMSRVNALTVGEPNWPTSGKMQCKFAPVKFCPFPGQQIMLGYGKSKEVRIWGDDEAVELNPDPVCDHYHRFMQHLMGSGYNHVNAVQSCGM